MSEINSHDDIQTLPQEREKLYQLVWSEPAERITALYDISTELLAKRCSEMCIRDSVSIVLEISVSSKNLTV